MKCRLIVLALAASLSANAWLLWHRADAVAAPAPTTVSSAADRVSGASGHRGAAGIRAGDAAAASGTARGVVWREPRRPEELRALADELRAAGFPEGGVRFLIANLIQRQVRGASEFAKMPFWHQTYGGKAAHTVLEKMNAEMREAERAALGKYERDPSELDPIARSSRYGALPDEKIGTLMKIERDYGEVYWQQRRNAGNDDALDTFEGRNRIRLIEEEKERDIAAVLTPEEFADYGRRQSRAAQAVIAGVRDIEISEEEYTALYELQRSSFEAMPRAPGLEETAAALRHAATSPEQVRAVLKDDRFYSYLENTDPVYGAVAKFAKTAPTLTRDQTYQLYQLQFAATLAVAQTGASGRTSDLTNTTAGRAALAPFNAQMEALLGPELAASYRRSSAGRIFGAAGPSGR